MCKAPVGPLGMPLGRTAREDRSVPLYVKSFFPEEHKDKGWMEELKRWLLPLCYSGRASNRPETFWGLIGALPSLSKTM